MKKLCASIMILISLIFIGMYIVSMNSNKVSASFNVKDMSGNRNSLENDKIIVNINQDVSSNNQGIITKDGVHVSRANLETSISKFNMSDSMFKINKELLRGQGDLQMPIYDDEQYKIVIDVDCKPMISKSKSSLSIVVSYLDKKINKTKKLRLKVPNNYNYNYIELIGVENNNGILTLAFQGNLPNDNNYNGPRIRQIEICSINLKEATIKSEKIFKNNQELGEINTDSGKIYLKNGELLRIVAEIQELEDTPKEPEAKTKETKGKSIRMLRSISLKDYSIKNTELKDVDFLNVYIGESKVYLYNTLENKIVLSSVDLKTKEIKKYSDIILSDIYKVDESKESLIAHIEGEKQGKVYFSISKYDNNSGILNDLYIELIDIEKTKTLYRGKIECNNNKFNIKVELAS